MNPHNIKWKHLWLIKPKRNANFRKTIIVIIMMETKALWKRAGIGNYFGNSSFYWSFSQVSQMVLSDCVRVETHSQDLWRIRVDTTRCVSCLRGQYALCIEFQFETRVNKLKIQTHTNICRYTQTCVSELMCVCVLSTKMQTCTRVSDQRHLSNAQRTFRCNRGCGLVDDSRI